MRIRELEDRPGNNTGFRRKVRLIGGKKVFVKLADLIEPFNYGILFGAQR